MGRPPCGARDDELDLPDGRARCAAGDRASRPVAPRRTVRSALQLALRGVIGAEFDDDELLGACDLLPVADRELAPEQRLLVQLLDVALADLVDRDQRVRAAAQQWFSSDTREAFGLRWVCDHLDLDVSDVRRRLGRLAGGLSARRRSAREAWAGPRRAHARAA